MIESGVKTEEYREIKEHWWRRFSTINRTSQENQDIEWHKWECYRFDKIKFSYGYTNRTMTFECKGITIGRGKAEWGAPDNDVFIIILGRRVE